MIQTETPHFTSLKKALASLFGDNARIAEQRQVFGGDINLAYQLALTDGTQIFMKKNAKENVEFFIAETAGIAAIAQTDTISTPRILCTGTEERQGGYSFLLMDLIASKSRVQDYWEIFARELAAMHQAPTKNLISEGSYGFFQDNFIGAGKQINTPRDSWVAFFRDCRLSPQFRRAEGYFDKTDLQKIIRLLDRLEDFLIEPERPSLLHGDLWSGNVIAGGNGRAWLIDPAAYVGHAEADLAMTELFGGFPHNFYAAHKESAPLQPGYESRRSLYNLYHLLNHLNLFGRSYLSSVRNTLAQYAS